MNECSRHQSHRTESNIKAVLEIRGGTESGLGVVVVGWGYSCCCVDYDLKSLSLPSSLPRAKEGLFWHHTTHISQMFSLLLGATQWQDTVARLGGGLCGRGSGGRSTRGSLGGCSRRCRTRLAYSQNCII